MTTPTYHETVKQDIVNQLAWNSRVDASDIAVTVDNFQVTLTGTVPFYD
jgi:osmotically-inducible protein OsmY